MKAGMKKDRPVRREVTWTTSDDPSRKLAWDAFWDAAKAKVVNATASEAA